MIALLAGETEGKVNLPDTKNPYIPVIAKLYEALEMEAALSALQEARHWPGNGVQEHTWLELMDGIFQAGAGNEAAINAFKRALMFDVNAHLPVPVSPSLLKLYNKARQDVGLTPIVPQPDSPPPARAEKPPPVAPAPIAPEVEPTAVKPVQMAPVARKLPAWVPWAAMGAGAALTVGSSIMYFQARDDYRTFDAGISACGGCVPEPDLASRRSRGHILKWAAYGGYALGGAALITGAVLVYLDLPRSYRITPGEHDAPGRAGGVAGAAGGGAPHPHARALDAKPQARVVPWLGPGSGGAMLSFQF